jgi:hypothetical protein
MEATPRQTQLSQLYSLAYPLRSPLEEKENPLLRKWRESQESQDEGKEGEESFVEWLRNEQRLNRLEDNLLLYQNEKVMGFFPDVPRDWLFYQQPHASLAPIFASQLTNDQYQTIDNRAPPYFFYFK